jgi:malonyl-CoA O-methyltransferase
MNQKIDTTVVAKRFSDAADTYDTWAKPQALAAQALCSLLPDGAHHVLDLGCGTGLLTTLLMKRYPTATITGVDPAPGMIGKCRQKWPHDTRMTFVVASAETYEPPHQFDLIAATCSFQWFPDKPLALQHIKNALVPGGFFCFAVPVIGTLSELFQSVYETSRKRIDKETFFTATDYIDWLSQANFEVQHMTASDLAVHAPNSLYVINSIRGIGATSWGLSEEDPLSATQINALINHYDSNYATKDGVRLTYRILYGVAKKKEA